MLTIQCSLLWSVGNISSVPEGAETQDLCHLLLLQAATQMITRQPDSIAWVQYAHIVYGVKNNTCTCRHTSAEQHEGAVRFDESAGRWHTSQRGRILREVWGRQRGHHSAASTSLTGQPSSDLPNCLLEPPEPHPTPSLHDHPACRVPPANAEQQSAPF